MAAIVEWTRYDYRTPSVGPAKANEEEKKPAASQKKNTINYVYLFLLVAGAFILFKVLKPKK